MTEGRFLCEGQDNHEESHQGRRRLRLPERSGGATLKVRRRLPDSLRRSPSSRLATVKFPILWSAPSHESGAGLIHRARTGTGGPVSRRAQRPPWCSCVRRELLDAQVCEGRQRKDKRERRSCKVLRRAPSSRHRRARGIQVSGGVAGSARTREVQRRLWASQSRRRACSAGASGGPNAGGGKAQPARLALRMLKVKMLTSSLAR